MKKLKAVDLIEDFDFYPRLAVDQVHVHTLALALEAGDELPPIVVDKKSKRIVDGFHRRRAHLRVYGDTAEVDVVEKTYANDKEMFLDCVQLNSGASRARPFATGDHARVISFAERFSVDDVTIAHALHVTVDRVTEIKTTRMGKLSTRRHRSSNEALQVPLKNTIKHMAGKVLTDRQIEMQHKLGGNDQSFYVNQVIILIEEGYLDRENVRLMEKMQKLAQLLEGVLAQAASA